MRIGYVTTCPKVPVGGVSVIFWHVALLREMGVEAFVVPDKASTYDPWWMVPKVQKPRRRDGCVGGAGGEDRPRRDP